MALAIIPGLPKVANQLFVPVWGFRAFAPTEGPQSVAAAKCLRVSALIDNTSLGVKQAYTNSLRG